MTDIVYIGPFPPPTHGQSVATEMLYKRLCEADLRVRRIDTGPGADRSPVIARLAGFFRACVAIVSGGPIVYLSANSQRGAVMTLIHVALARLRGKHIIVHHHSYRRIAQHSGVMAAIAHVAGRDALHVVNCDRMGAELAAAYPAVGQTCSLLNTEFVEDCGAPSGALERDGAGRALVLGHMSNLCEPKGIGRAIAIFRAARLENLAEKLLVAGPFADDVSRRLVKEAEAEFGAAFDYLGPVYGADKAAFFRSIDLFVFPTWYEDETVGIVNLEALAHGVPVISSAQCCIPSTLGAAGIALPRDADPAEASLPFVAAFSRDRTVFRQRAREQFEALQREQIELLQSFLDRLRAWRHGAKDAR